MSTQKIITLYGIFGCWTKFIPGSLGTILYGIWLAMVSFWIVINFCGVIMSLMDKIEIKKSAQKVFNEDLTRVWLRYNTLALCSYVVCGEYGISLMFIATSCVFMFLTIKQIKQKKQ